jgi:magnesium transporter
MGIPLTRTNLNDPVTEHMHDGFARLHINQTVGEALVWLRAHPPRGRIVYLYVLDDEGILRGVVPTRGLLLSEPDRRIADIMVCRVLSLPARATVLETCEFFIQHRLLAFPVVDEGGRLRGVVDMEIYLDERCELEGNGRDDLFQRIGVRLDDARPHSPFRAFRVRFPWLGCNLAAGILAAFLAGMFQDELNRLVALAFFIPVVLNLAESVSSQSVSLMLQAMHGSRVSLRSILQRLRDELITGVLLGLGSASAVALIAFAWLRQPQVALCLIGGITGGVAGAALMGLAMPVVLRQLRLEPRVAAGPVALAAADVLTIVLYLNLARWLLH